MRWIAFAAALAAAAAPAFAEDFVIRGGKDASLVKFLSKAAMESFEGKASAVSGSLSLDVAALADTLTIAVVVDMTALDTGISLRNEHMRENHLHTDQFPTATFEGAKVQGGGALEAGVPRRVELAGTLTIHGVARPATIPADLAWDGARCLTIDAEFPVALADHGIPRPKFLLLKLGEVQKVTVHLVAELATGEPEATSKETANEEAATP